MKHSATQVEPCKKVNSNTNDVKIVGAYGKNKRDCAPETTTPSKKMKDKKSTYH